MTHDDVERIESRLGVALPADYRAFILDNSGDTVRGLEIVFDPEFVIDTTLELRLRGPTVEFRWPNECVVIGHSGCGDFYCLDCAEFPSPVKCWDHETGNLERIASSFKKWIMQHRQA